jgi:hypothetical protein
MTVNTCEKNTDRLGELLLSGGIAFLLNSQTDSLLLQHTGESKQHQER